MKTFEDYQIQMYPYYRDYEAFKNRSNKICYIPENAENLDEAFTYSDLRNEVNDWLQDNQDYLTEHETTLEDLVNNMFECLSGEFPSTFLNGLDY